MNGMRMLPADLGLPPLTAEQVPALTMAGGTVLAALLAGWLAAWLLQPVLSRWLLPRLDRGEQTAEEQEARLVRRLRRLVRHGVSALVLLSALAAWSATGWALLVLAVATAVACLLAVRALLLAAGLGGTSALAAGVIAGIAALSGAAGGLEPVQDVLRRVGFDIGSYRLSLLTVASSLVTAIILYAGVRLALRVVRMAVRHNRRLDGAQSLLIEKLATVGIVAAAFLIGIDLVGIDLTALAVFSGALGLAVGFGLQKTFGNLIAGIILLMDRSIKPGDVIVVGDSFGQVNKIGVRAVSVITRDGKEHLIPNENLMTQEVENWSFSSRNVRVRIPVGVSYEADIRRAQELMIEAALECPRVLRTPSPNVWLIGFGASSVDFEILAWIADPEEGVGNVRSSVLNALWDKLKEAGIGIPYPQQDIYIKSWPGRNGPAGRSLPPEDLPG